jgi:hypothetical protein
MKERLTIDSRKIYARESPDDLLSIMTKDELRKQYNEIFDRLQEYEVAEEQGKLIRTPCKVGDTVYVKYYGDIVNAYIVNFEINSKGIVANVYIDPDTYMEYDAEDLFLTREQAVKALEGKEDEEK